MKQSNRHPMTAPVTLPAVLVERLSIYPRAAFILPYARYATLQASDLLWVREAHEISGGKDRKGELSIRFGRNRHWDRILWSAEFARPSAGRRKADIMPVQCSRITLQIEGVETVPLRSLTDEQALRAGASMDPDGGFRSAQADTDVFLPFTHGWQAAEHLWQETFGRGCDEANPDVQFVLARPIFRNISRMVSGIGSGGVR